MLYIIKDKERHHTFINQLRDVLADHDHPERLLDGHPNPESLFTFNNPPLLARKKRRHTWPTRLIHIKLQLAKRKTSTTLAIRDDNLHLIGFMNQEGVWYDLGHQFRDDRLLPAEYNSKNLKWGSYIDILGIRDMLFGSFFEKDYVKEKSVWDEVREKMGTEDLGKNFARNAVRTLSRYPDVDEGESKRALVGLMIMICESARLNPVHKHIEDGWDDDSGTGFSKQLMEYIQCSYFISEILVRWKDWGCSDGDRWPDGLLGWPFSDNEYWEYAERTMLDMEIRGPKDALAAAHLVLNPKTLERD